MAPNYFTWTMDGNGYLKLYGPLVRSEAYRLAYKLEEDDYTDDLEVGVVTPEAVTEILG